MSHRELLPIPPIETANDPVRSAADLRQRWRALLGPLGFEERLLWFGLIGPDRCFTKKLSQVQIRPRPQGRIIWNLMSALRTLLDDLRPGTTVALLLTGPGRGPVASADPFRQTMSFPREDSMPCSRMPSLGSTATIALTRLGRLSAIVHANAPDWE